MDTREEPELRTKINESEMLLYISLRSANADGSERMEGGCGQSLLLLFFNEHSSIRHTSVGKAERGDSLWSTQAHVINDGAVHSLS
jgi:hypothetical protein